MKTPSKLFVALSLLVGVGAASFLALRHEGQFSVEFGSERDRTTFISLLTENGISYRIEKDYLDRVWVIPDQTKRKQFEEVQKLFYEKTKPN